jgi:cytoskeletal protein RodZ
MLAALRAEFRPVSRLWCRVAFKPTSSILTPVETITRDGEATEIVTKGRHDPCVGIRGVPVVEAMMALVLADQKLLHRAQCGKLVNGAGSVTGGVQTDSSVVGDTASSAAHTTHDAMETTRDATKKAARETREQAKAARDAAKNTKDSAVDTAKADHAASVGSSTNGDVSASQSGVSANGSASGGATVR